MSKYDNRGNCLDYLAKSLNKSRLCVFLGAGISIGLPDWDSLVKKLCEKCSVTYSETSNEVLAKICLNKVGMNNLKKYVKYFLYHDNNFDPNKLINYPFLVSLGAMCTGSKVRGRVENIVTYNYDDIIEQYLEYYGIKPQSIIEFPYYSNNSDIKIYHPHGFLPYNKVNDSDNIVLDISSLYQAKNDESFWPEMETLVKHNCMLFIGLSFNDDNLKELLDTNMKNHPTSLNDDPYGFYFAKSKSFIKDGKLGKELDKVNNMISNREYLRTLNIFPILVDDWNEMPILLAEISRRSLSMTS